MIRALLLACILLASDVAPDDEPCFTDSCVGCIDDCLSSDDQHGA